MFGSGDRNQVYRGVARRGQLQLQAGAAAWLGLVGPGRSAETAEHELVGWVHVFGAARVESDPFAELGGLVVTEGWRGRGVGAQLVAAAERWALENGYRTMRIRSRTERVDAHRFFNRLGYSSRKTQLVFERAMSSEG